MDSFIVPEDRAGVQPAADSQSFPIIERRARALPRLPANSVVRQARRRLRRIAELPRKVQRLLSTFWMAMRSCDPTTVQGDRLEKDIAAAEELVNNEPLILLVLEWLVAQRGAVRVGTLADLRRQLPQLLVMFHKGGQR